MIPPSFQPDMDGDEKKPVEPVFWKRARSMGLAIESFSTRRYRGSVVERHASTLKVCWEANIVNRSLFLVEIRSRDGAHIDALWIGACDEQNSGSSQSTNSHVQIHVICAEIAPSRQIERFTTPRNKIMSCGIATTSVQVKSITGQKRTRKYGSGAYYTYLEEPFPTATSCFLVLRPPLSKGTTEYGNLWLCSAGYGRRWSVALYGGRLRQ
jgi:hypothetical protein